MQWLGREGNFASPSPSQCVERQAGARFRCSALGGASKWRHREHSQQMWHIKRSRVLFSDVRGSVCCGECTHCVRQQPAPNTAIVTVVILTGANDVLPVKLLLCFHALTRSCTNYRSRSPRQSASSECSKCNYGKSANWMRNFGTSIGSAG